MTTPSRSIAPAQALVGALAGVGIGACFGTVFVALPAMTSLRVQAWELGMLAAPAVVAVAVALAVVAVRLWPALGRGAGWPAACAGVVAAIVGVLALDDKVGGADFSGTLLAVIGVGAGLAFGGLFLAMASAASIERLSIGIGLATGLVAPQTVMNVFQRPTVGSPIWPYLITLAMTAAAAALCWKRVADAGTRRWGPSIVTAAAGAVVVVAGLYLRSEIIRNFIVTEDGMVSQRRMDFVEIFARYSAVGLAVIAGLLLTWYAYRLGKADLARWPVLGVALAGPMTMTLAGFGFGTGLLTARSILLIAAAAAAGGALLTRWADRWFAWDALGAIAAAGGMALLSMAFHEPDFRLTGSILLVSGCAFALGAALTRAASLGAGATGLGLGMAAMLLAALALGPVTIEHVFGGFDEVRWTGPVITAIGALVVIGLFAFRRAADRVRQELRAQGELIDLDPKA